MSNSSEHKAAQPAPREVVSETIALDYEIDAEPSAVFEALTANIGGWWTHSFKDSRSVRFEPEVGGRFYEEWKDGGGALYAHVVYIEAPRKLRLSGPMGMRGAVACTMQFELEDMGGRTRLALTHDVFGYIPAGTVDSYRAGWKELLGTSLKNFVEQGGRNT